MASIEAKVLPENQKIPGSRSDYIGKIAFVFIVLPLIGWLIHTFTGVSLNPFSYIEKTILISGKQASGFSFNPLTLWYIQIPLFIYYTRQRVLNAGLNQWLTFVFILPVINIFVWFYRGGQ